MQSNLHKLSLTIKAPKTAKEGKNFEFTFKVKNIGDKPFLGGTIVIQLYWKDLPEKVNKVLKIENPLKPLQETPQIRHSQEPLSNGFTWFIVGNAIASDKSPVQVFKNETDLVFPYPTAVSANGQVAVSQPILHAIRTRTIDQIYQLYALIATTVSLSSVVILQIIDWILRYYFPMP
jgi:hypothetical protein